MTAPDWNPTHKIPDNGLMAREKPDASLEPLQRIAHGLEVRIVKASGGWSKIRTEQGWEGWVDGTRLTEISASTPAASPPPPPPPPPPPVPSTVTETDPAPEPEPGPEAEAAPEPETAPADWAPTHTAPDKGLPTRKDPDSKAKTTGRLEAGTEVEVADTDGLWSKVRSADGAEAWVNGRLLVAVDEPETSEQAAEPEPASWAATHTVPDGGLPARAKPDASLDQLLRIQAGTGVRVIETSGAWSQIDIESGWGAWVDNRRLEPVGGAPAATAPAAAPAPAPEPEVWAATHTIPEGGLSAWSEPKADRQPILKVRGGTPVQVVDTAGAWSRIRTEPGWEAWVDGRRLAEPD